MNQFPTFRSETGAFVDSSNNIIVRIVYASDALREYLKLCIDVWCWSKGNDTDVKQRLKDAFPEVW